jgi:diphosphate-dependent phosphofructokinase
MTHSLQSQLQLERQNYKPTVPSVLESVASIEFEKSASLKVQNDVAPQFAHTSQEEVFTLKAGGKKELKPLRVGVVFSGGQASGGHNVIWGLFDAIKEVSESSKLIGFLNGPGGICDQKSVEITKQMLEPYRNQGGFDLIGSGRTKIETPEQLDQAKESVKALDLDGLVIIGGDDSNTNAAVLAEHFAAAGIKTKVAGVPKTIDGDLKTEYIESSFGFDTACKIYSDLIGNIAKDALSAKKYTHFIKLMGRSASQIALECALKTGANLALISEEIAQKKLSLGQIVDSIADLIEKRSAAGLSYGIILIPEGIIEFIPEMKVLIQELNTLLAQSSDSKALAKLSPASKACFESLPASIQKQLLLDRDPHGNVKVAQIESEKLLIEMVEKKLQQRAFKGSFSPLNHYFGYEGRAALPSNFDATYCYTLGKIAGALLAHGKTGYICAVKNLKQSAEKWKPMAVPIASMLHIEMRKGKQKAVIEKALVDLSAGPFQAYAEKRDAWSLESAYVCPGPIQFFGPTELTDRPPLTLELST